MACRRAFLTWCNTRMGLEKFWSQICNSETVSNNAVSTNLVSTNAIFLTRFPLKRFPLKQFQITRFPLICWPLARFLTHTVSTLQQCVWGNSRKLRPYGELTVQCKGQIILKGLLVSSNSPKKQTNKFVFLSWGPSNTWNLSFDFKFQVFQSDRMEKQIHLFVFWEEVRLDIFVFKSTDL